MVTGTNIEIFVDFGNGPVLTDVEFTNLSFGLDVDATCKNIKRKQLSQTFTFCGKDAEKMIELEKGCDRCKPLPVNIICGSDLIRGRISLFDGEFDEDLCEVKIKIQTEDDYTCLFDEWDIPRNICSLATGIEVKNFIGTLECVVCAQGVQAPGTQPPWPADLVPGVTPGIVADGAFVATNNCLPDNLGWTITVNQPRTFTVEATEQVINYYAQTTWCRETFTGPQPPGSTWVEATPGTWVRPVQTVCEDYEVLFSEPILFGFPNPMFQGENKQYVKTCKVVEGYNNGFKLEDVLNFLAIPCGLEICSNFYGINPDGDFPNNTPYQCALQDLQDIVIFQNTAVKNPEFEGIETICEKSLKEAITSLKNTHNVDIQIEGNKLRIEHVSYFRSKLSRTLDLTTNKYKECLEHTNKFNLDNFRIPQTESWSWQDETKGRFAAWNIRYCECYDIGVDNPRSIGCFNPDVFDMNANPDDYEDDGFAIVSTIVVNGVNTILDENSAFESERLIECYWQHEMFHDCFISGDKKYCAETLQRSKVQEGILVPMCCEDFAKFTPNQEVMTQYGWGEIVDWTYDTADECLNLTLAHKIPNCCEGECECTRTASKTYTGNIDFAVTIEADSVGILIDDPNNNAQVIYDEMDAFINGCLDSGATAVMQFESPSQTLTAVIGSGQTLSAGVGWGVINVSTESDCNGGFEHTIGGIPLQGPNQDPEGKTFSLFCYKCI